MARVMRSSIQFQYSTNSTAGWSGSDGILPNNNAEYASKFPSKRLSKSQSWNPN